MDDIIKEIMACENPDKEVFLVKYPSFFTKYPVLSRVLFDKSVDKSVLEYMMKEKGKIDENTKTEHDASVEVGTMLLEKYISPMIN